MNEKKPVAQPEPYDLYLAANPINEVRAIIKSIADQQGKIFEQKLADLMQSDVRVQANITVSQDFLDSKSDDRYFRCWAKTVEPQPKFSVLCIQKSLVRSIMDLICGGTGELIPDRAPVELSTGEQKITHKMAAVFLDSIYESLKASVPLLLEVAGKSDSMNADLRFKGLRHHIVSTRFKITTPTFSGDMMLASPTNNLRSYAIDDAENHPKLREQLIENLTTVSLPVSATLSRQASSLRKVFSLQPGDIVPLDNPMHAEVFIGQKLLFEAKVFSSGSKLMLKVDGSEEGKQDELKEAEVQTDTRRVREERRRRSTTQRESAKPVRERRK